MKLFDFLDTQPLNNLSEPSQMVDEIKIDNEQGAGNVPANRNVDYLGIRVLMKPKTFLSLVRQLERSNANSVDHIKSELQAGKGIASPFLDIDIPQEWESGDVSSPAKIVGHEGRNRMWTAFELDGNDPVEVHLLFPGLRSRHITDEWKARLKQGMIAQGTNSEIRGPLFVVGHSDEELDEVYPGQSSGKLKNRVKAKYGGEINCQKAAKIKSDPDESSFFKKRASWYQSLHCKGAKKAKKKKTNESACCDNCKD